jgi:lipopolysaccharide biosynthesis glycosyltransferase
VSGQRITVLTLADAGYAMPLAVTVRSLLDNLRPGWSVRLLVIDGGLDAVMRSRLVASWSGSPAWAESEIEWIAPDYGAAGNLPVCGRVPVLTYARLAVESYAPAGAERVIVLDSDLLVTGDVADLWEMHLGDGVIAAALDPFIPALGTVDGLKVYRELGLTADAPYFNAGVMVVEMVRWKTAGIGRRAMDFIARYGADLHYYEQDALNAVLAGKWIRLDSRWQVQPRACRLWGAAAKESEGIVHFSGRLKPWVFEGGTAADRHYFEYLDRTDWRGTRPPRGWRSSALRLYERLLRPAAYPLEVRLLALLRRLRRRWVRGPSAG